MTGIGLRTDDDSKDLDEMKRVKAKIPVRQHLQLQRIKILAGQNISETIQEALDDYFEETRQEGGEA